MWLIHTSKDLLLVVISFSVLLISVMLAWGMFYMVMIGKQFYDIIKGWKERMKKIDATIDAFKDKIEHSASYLLLIGEGVKKLVELAKDYIDKNRKKDDSE